MAAVKRADILAMERHRFDSDGEGVRTLVILSGCPLRCRYCINSYAWDGTVTGRTVTPEELLRVVSVDSVYFIATGGGITFGGGEPLLHAEFISELIDIAPREWSFTVETSLALPFASFEALIEKVDLFIVDIKSMDREVYRAYTGGELATAEENLSLLLKRIGPERILVRVPQIPDYADAESQAASIARLKELGITRIDAFRYRRESAT